MRAACAKASCDNFPKLFSDLHHLLPAQYHYSIFINNILICFEHPLCSLVCLTTYADQFISDLHLT